MEQHPSVSPRLFDRLHSMLVYENVQINRERGNSGAGRSVCFGIVGKRSEPVGESRWNKKRPEVWAELQEIAKSLPVPPDWTSCVVNMDFSCLWHVDSGNLGTSTIVSFGCYSGGELAIENPDKTVTLLDTYLKPTVGEFNKIRHRVMPLSGVKFSLVFFKIDPSGGKKGRVKQAQPTSEDVIALIDPSHMFNAVPGVSRVKNGRSYVDVKIPNPLWSKLDNPKLIHSSTLASPST